MSRFKQVGIMAAVVFFLAVPITASAAPVTFFGEDLGLGEATPLPAWPNASAAEADFLSYLVGVGSEDFESFADGTTAPLPISFGASGVTATLNGNGEIDVVAMGSTNGFGRYATSGTHYWESSDVFSITFGTPVAAFGFYGIDIGDFSGQVTLTLANGGVVNLVIPSTIDGPGGSVIFFGFIDYEDEYVGIAFGNTEPGFDFFAFDDMTVGTASQLALPLDIKPGSCPNPINTKSNGVLPVALLGTENFDVLDVDPATIRLEDVAPLRFKYGNVATPMDPGAAPCDCNTLGPDGYADIMMHFDTQEIVAALGAVTDGEIRELTLTFTSFSGIEYEAKDCVRIIHKVSEGPPTIAVNTASPAPGGISLSLAEPSAVSLVVYDVTGRKVRTLFEGSLGSGPHTIGWDGRSDSGSMVPRGVYFCQARYAGTEKAIKILQMR